MALGAFTGAIIGYRSVAMISKGISGLASRALTDGISSMFYGGSCGTWEDYAIAFLFGSVSSGMEYGVKLLFDSFARPAVSQLVKRETRGVPLDKEKYLYDVVIRAATFKGSNDKLNTNLGAFNLDVDLGKCIYRATAKFIYSSLKE